MKISQYLAKIWTAKIWTRV